MVIDVLLISPLMQTNLSQLSDPIPITASMPMCDDHAQIVYLNLCDVFAAVSLPMQPTWSQSLKVRSSGIPLASTA